MSVAAPLDPVASSGEPTASAACDLMTEALRWQRYTFFRPWYAGRRVVDAGFGEGSGTAYATLFAADALGLGHDHGVTARATRRHSRTRFLVSDLEAHDYADADLVVSFGTLDRLSDPEPFLRSLDRCPGGIVVSSSRTDEFIGLIQKVFGRRQIRFLSQENRWPGLIREGLHDGASHTLAVIDGGPLPAWPSIGLAMPCCGEAEAAATAVTRLAMHYPGDLHVTVVAQGCGEEALARLRHEEAAAPHVLSLIERKENDGYGRGANLALESLRVQGFDLYGVAHDDILPSPDCVPQLAAAAIALVEAGHRVGLIGPASNEVEAPQNAQIGRYGSLDEMHERAFAWAAERHSHVDLVPQVRGLFFLMSPECLDAIGGFDPVFGLGGFEDEDLSLRVRLSGFPLWFAPGAFLHHQGGSSFKRRGLDPNDSLVRNLALFLEKWDAETVREAMAREVLPDGLDPFVPLDARLPRTRHFITINGAPVDLVHQASEFDLASWIVTVLRDRPREARFAVLDALQSLN